MNRISGQTIHNPINNTAGNFTTDGRFKQTPATAQIMAPIQIAICDDQPLSLSGLSESVVEYFTQKNIPCEMHRFLTPSEVFDYLKEAKLHILFMDLEFGKKEEDGILWTKKITAASPDTLVLILTAYENRYKEGYRVKAFRFMTKPLIAKELLENLDDCLETFSEFHTLKIKQNHTTLSLAVKEISYLEAFAGGSSVHTCTGKIYYSENSLLQLEKELPKNLFFRIHKSFLVNLDHVTDLIFSKHEIILDKAVRLPVARRKWMDFQGSYIRHDVD